MTELWPHPHSGPASWDPAFNPHPKQTWETGVMLPVDRGETKCLGGWGIGFALGGGPGFSPSMAAAMLQG